jgi:L-cysteine S-thiosulfotransferase
MRKNSFQSASVTGVMTMLLACTMLVSFSANADQSAKKQNKVLSKDAQVGKKVAFSRKKGNCLACHMIQGGKASGNIAPPLIAMKVRFPDKKKLRTQIWDATARNPESSMPPFGRHRIISEKEIDQVTDFVWSL